MTKTHKVIPIEDYAVVIDEEAEINPTDYFIDSDGELFRNIFASHNLKKSKPRYNKIVATYNKRLTGLPVVKKDDEWKMALKDLRESGKIEANYLPVSGAFVHGFQLGFKAAQKGFSEEDMREAISNAMKVDQLKKDSIKKKGGWI